MGHASRYGQAATAVFGVTQFGVILSEGKTREVVKSSDLQFNNQWGLQLTSW